MIAPGLPTPLGGRKVETSLRETSTVLAISNPLSQAMRRVGFYESQIRRSFSPHVTLDYRHAPFASRTIAPLAWRVSEFMLVDSLYRRSQHEVLGCWPLVSRQQTLDW